MRKTDKPTKRIPAVFAAAIVLSALVFALGLGDRQKTWADLPYTLLSFDGGVTRSTAQGDAYGLMNRGPGLDLPAGEYRLKYRIEGDAENAIQISSANNARVTPQEIVVPAGGETVDTTFVVHDAAENLQLRVDFAAGTAIDVQEMRLYSPIYRDHAFTFAFAVLGMALLYALYACGTLTPARRGRLILLGFAVLIASGPAFKDTICIGHDTTFHLVRLCNLADGLARGQFPVRIGGYSYNGYGAITSVFYPDLFLYIPALMMNLGASLQYAVNVFFVAINIASAVSMYAAAKRIFRDEWIGVCASVLYTLSIYRISDVFTRYAFGEMTAMALLPLFLLGLYEVVLGDKKRWPVLALSAAGIFLSHMLSTLICAVTAVGVGVLFIVKIIRERRLTAIAQAAAVAGLLCAFQLVPFLMYSMQGIGAQSLAKDPAYFALHPAQLFLLGAGELSGDPRDSGLATFALEIGLPLLLGAMLSLYVAATAEKPEKEGKAALLFAAAGAVFAVMATQLFPWSHVRVLTRGLSDYLQFPWRFLMMTAALLALCGGYGCVRFAKGHGEQITVAMLALAAACALPTLTDEARNPDYIAFGETVSPHLLYTEYTIPQTSTAPTLNRDMLLDGDVEITAYEKRGTIVAAQVHARSDASIALPLFGYDGYRAEVNGEEVPWSLGENNRLSVSLEAGTQGELRVWFAGKPVWRVADGVSALTALLLCAWGIRRRKMNPVKV